MYIIGLAPRVGQTGGSGSNGFRIVSSLTPSKSLTFLVALTSGSSFMNSDTTLGFASLLVVIGIQRMMGPSVGPFVAR